ncbi:hypothetical protein UlMin_044259 [Ulmus minor]
MAAVAFTNPKFSPKITTTSVSRNYLTQSFFNPRIPTIPKSSSSNLKTLSFKPQIVRCQSFDRQPPPPKFWRPDEQSPGASLTSKEKLDIARQLAKLDVDIIEAGFPAASKDDFEAVKMIAKEVGNSVDADGYVPVFVGFRDRPRIHTFIATSPIHMEYKLRKTKKEVIEIARSMVKFARSLGCEDVEFSPENAGRSEREFLYEILGEVIKAGATILNIPDTWGKNCKIIMDTGNNRAGNFLKWKSRELRRLQSSINYKKSQRMVEGGVGGNYFTCSRGICEEIRIQQIFGIQLFDKVGKKIMLSPNMWCRAKKMWKQQIICSSTLIFPILMAWVVSIIWDLRSFIFLLGLKSVAGTGFEPVTSGVTDIILGGEEKAWEHPLLT